MATAEIPRQTRGNPGGSPISHGTIPDAFRAVAAQHADRLVLHDRHRSVTYAEADRESNRVAHQLLARDDADRPLVVVAPLGVESILVMLGAVKTGRLLVPLDPRWPPEQWSEIARRTNGLLVVPDDATRGTLAAAVAARTLTFDELYAARDDDPHVAVDRDAPAFVFFTSGSTGAPKGTVAGHEMALRVLGMFDVSLDDRIALLAPLGFITGALSALGITLTGAAGFCLDLSGGDLGALLDWIDRHGITIIGLPVTVIRVIARMAIDDGRTLDSLQFVGHGGEAGTVQHFEDARRAFPNATFRNSYGQTEAGPVAAYEMGHADVPAPELGPVPVGYPWPWVQVDIVDEQRNPVLPAMSGEITVTGRHVAFGYWDEPLLTMERFRDNGDGTRTVFTGDRGRVRPDGMLEHLGRLDRRVKINGQLVDLTVIERELEAVDVVRHAVVSAVPTEDDGYRVVAHVVLQPREHVTVGVLRRALASRVPSYMVPRAFFRIDHVPQTANGKVDRVWLRDTAIGALPLDAEYVAPETAREREVAALFAEVLGVETVGVRDDFFELGGDSLSVLDLLAGLLEEFGVDLRPSDLLLDATVTGVVARLDRDRAHVHHAPVVVTVRVGEAPQLWCVPGAADTPVQFRPLARRLGDAGVSAFAYHGMDERAFPDRTIDAIARRNVAAMRAVDPHGPYRVAGFSFGGTVALAMAHQLEQAGAEVELLALLEPSLGHPTGPGSEPGPRLVDKVRDRATEVAAGEQGTGVRVRQGVALGQAATRYARRQLCLPTVGVVPRRGRAQHDAFLLHHRRLLRKHTPEPFGGPTLVFGSERFLAAYAPTLDRLLPPEHLGGQRRNVVVPGEHLDLVREPNVAEVARLLDAFVAELSAAQQCAAGVSA